MDLEYYKDQYEQLLNGNAELTAQVESLKKQTAPELQKATKELKQTMEVIRGLVSCLREQLYNLPTVQKRISEILFGDIYNEICDALDEDD